MEAGWQKFNTVAELAADEDTMRFDPLEAQQMLERGMAKVPDEHRAKATIRIFKGEDTNYMRLGYFVD